MLSLVDYEGSGEDSDQADDEHCISAEIVPRKHPMKPNYVSDEDSDELFGVPRVRDDLPPSSRGNDELKVALAALPPPPSVQKSVARGEGEDVIDELVRPKSWEIEIAKKVRKRKRHGDSKGEKKLRKSEKRKDASSDDRVRPKVVIDAFGALKKLPKSSDVGESDESQSMRPQQPIASSTATKNLLSLLPQPKSKTSDSKSASIILPKSVGTSKAVPSSEDRSVAKRADSDNEDLADEHDEAVDFFGLKSTGSEEKDVYLPKLSNTSYGPSKLLPSTSVSFSNDDSAPEDAGHSALGVIDNQEAMQIIYTRDMVNAGTLSNAADAVNNMVDVRVDEVLGPNVQATLLKNLHNKSIAEAAISHLSSLPKAKTGGDMVARRKHQITYLANLAVAREEQLAEQWSQNRQNKRISAQKYGFF